MAVANRPSVPAVLLLIAFSLIYVPVVGHGFVKDDFNWISRSRISSLQEGVDVLAGAPTGFYRPMVSVSFAANRLTCGVHSFCYGLTNVLLALGCAAGIFVLGRALSLGPGGALFASALWLFNWHGINMAVLWISGRTALVAVLFSTVAAAAFVSRRFVAAAALSLAAMLSKEEAVLLPWILLAWALVDGARHQSLVLSRWIPWAAASVALEAVYFYWRGSSGAFTRLTAPSFYRLDFSVSRLAANGLQYLDRTATFAAVVIVLWWLICRPKRFAPPLANRSVIAFGVIWWCGMLAITVFLPVRSSLYACLPSVGVALCAAAVVSAAWPRIPERLQQRAVLAGVALPFLLWPIYYTRTGPLRREAELSAKTLDELQRVASARGAGTVVLIHDDRSERPSLESAFGGYIQEAADLIVAPPIRVWIDPPPGEPELAGLAHPSHVHVELILKQGALARLP
jgi:hypothetical protein